MPTHTLSGSCLCTWLYAQAQLLHTCVLPLSTASPPQVQSCAGVVTSHVDEPSAGTPHQFQNPLFGRTPPSADSDGQACLVSTYTPTTAQAAPLEPHSRAPASPPQRGNLFAASPATAEHTVQETPPPAEQPVFSGLGSVAAEARQQQLPAQQPADLAGLEALEAALGVQADPVSSNAGLAAVPSSSRREAFAESQDILAALAEHDPQDPDEAAVEQAGIPHVAGVGDLTALAAGIINGQLSPLDTPSAMPAEAVPTPLRMGANLSAMHMRALMNSQRKAQRPAALTPGPSGTSAPAARCADLDLADDDLQHMRGRDARVYLDVFRCHWPWRASAFDNLVNKACVCMLHLCCVTWPAWLLHMRWTMQGACFARRASQHTTAPSSCSLKQSHARQHASEVHSPSPHHSS